MGIDISSLKVSFGACKSCVTQSRYGNQYNNYNNGQQYYGNQQYFDYQTPLCSAAYYYKDNCNGKCRRMAKKASSGSSTYGSGGSDGFSPLGKFFLWVLSISGT